MNNSENELNFAMLYNQDYEYSVIGAMCIDPRFIDKVASVLSADDFIVPNCAAVYTEAQRRSAQREVFDPVIAVDILKGRADDAEGFIRHCMTLCPSLSNAEYHAGLIHSMAEERRLRNAIEEAMTSSQGNDLATNVAAACQNFLRGKLGRTHTMLEIMTHIADNLNQPPATRLNTGFPRLDETLKGMRPGNFVLVCARPAVGKTIFAQTIAENIARTGKKVLIYSLEMKSPELGERWLARASGVNLGKISDHALEEADWKSAGDAFQTLSALPILVCDDPSMTVDKIRSQLRTTPDIDMVIIDFVTLLRSTRKFENRNLEIGTISRELKLLAMELEIPIVALAQLNRGKQDTEEPTLAEIRDSGELEQNADICLFLWNVNKDLGYKGVKIAKNRMGKTGTVQMAFDGDKMRFTELSEADELLMAEDEPPKKKKTQKKGRWNDLDD